MTAPPRHRGTGSLLLAFGLVWCVVYGGASLFTGLHGYRVDVHMPWEMRIPFVPAVAPLYLSLNLLVLAPWVVFRTRRELLPWWSALIAQTCIAGVFFVLVPVDPVFPARHVEGAMAGIFALTDLLNLDHNAFPSLHVAFACTGAAAIASRLTGWWRGVPALWAAAIAVSTVLLHEHHVIDVVGGGLLATSTLRWLLPRTRSEGYARAARVEWLCLLDCWYFTRRRLRYLWVAVCVYAASVPRWRRRRPVRAGFCFLQHIDDLLDGDRACDGDPIAIVDGVMGQWARGIFDDSHLGELAACLWADTAALVTPGDDPRGEIAAVVACMRFDRVRVAGPLRLTEADLVAHHRRTFHYSLNLLLMLAGAEVRAHEVPDLVEAFGWCSVMRDLDEDLAKGLVNVPVEVLAATQARRIPELTYDALVGSEPVQAWIQRERARALRHLAAATPVLEALGSRPGAGLCRMFHRSIARLAAKSWLHSVPDAGLDGTVHRSAWMRGLGRLRRRGRSSADTSRR